MNELQIKYFLSLAEYKNFTNTAKALYVSQPAISKQISALEKELGYSLFFRSNRNVSLTPAGIILLETFTKTNEMYKNAMRRIKEVYNEKNRQLRLGCVDGMELGNLLNKIFGSFHEHFPNVEYYLEKHSPINLIKALNNDDLDAIITIESFLEGYTNLSSSVFLNAKHLLYVSINDPILTKENFNLSDFNDDTFISIDPNAVPPSNYSFFEWCKENGLNPKKVKYVPNVESQMLSVEVGFGITIADSLNKMYTNPLLKSFELKTSHNIFIAWKKDSTNLLIPSFAKLASQINNPSNED